MKIKTGNGAFLLVALVQSQQKALTKNDNLKFEAFEPVKRKKRTYKRSSFSSFTTNVTGK